MSNQNYAAPDGFTLDQNSGQYYKATQGVDQNGLPGTWYTWFYPETGQYQQQFYPDENAQAEMQHQSNAAQGQTTNPAFTAAQTQTANPSFAATQGQTANPAFNAAKTHAQPSTAADKKKKTPLLYFLPVATLVIGAAVAFILNGGFWDTPEEAGRQSRESSRASDQSGDNGQTTNQDGSDNQTAGQSSGNQTAGQGGSGGPSDAPNTPNQTAPAANVSGVSISALVNFGYFAQQGDWVYYGTWDSDDTHLYKKRVDGTEETELASNVNPSFIQVSGDWVYFRGYINRTSGIYRIRTDGTQLETLHETTSEFGYYLGIIQVDGDWIYFYNGGHNDATWHKIRTDGSEFTTIQEGLSIPAIWDDGWIYWSHSRIMRARPGEEGERLLSETLGTIRDMIVQGDLIYINCGNYSSVNSDGEVTQHQTAGIYVVNKDGSSHTRIYDKQVGALNVSEDGRTIYFREDNILWKIGADGSGLTQLSSKSIQNFAVFGDWVYFQDFTDGGLSRVRTDGSADERWG